ncbi:MAG: endonuclease/exonuclease/phosphatase family protein [Sulfitobacter sp.]|nr:endonuclease/exonuclease/phosphatase family protein [Sulfitobacter sp.]
MATFNTELSRDGPGLLLRDILRGEDPQIDAVIATILDVRPDVLALQGVDYDLEGHALEALRLAIAKVGLHFVHSFRAPPNAGLMTELDLDGDGKRGGPGDAQGYGRFYGQGSMAVLSRFPIDTAKVQDFSGFLWRDLPDAIMPEVEGRPFPSEAAQRLQRLHTQGAWVLPVMHPTLGPFHLMTYHASPPVFDGPEDRNGRRNHDETRFWTLYLAGELGRTSTGPFVLLGDANLDPLRGDGRHAAMKRLLSDPRLQDPLPGQATVVWPQTGPMRVDYLLPSADWTVLDGGVTAVGEKGSRHGLVWVDVTLIR